MKDYKPIRRLLTLLRQNWRLVLLLTALTVSLAVGGLLFLPPHAFRTHPVRIIAIGKSPAADVAFWRSMEQGLTAAAQEFGAAVEYRSARDESQVTQQAALVEQAIAERPDAILLAAVDQYRLAEPVRAARAAGIPVIMVDSTIATDLAAGDRPCFVATDNIAAGEKLGQFVTTLLPPGARLLLVSPSSRGDSLKSRETGVRQIIGQSCTILPTVEIQGDVSAVYTRIAEVLAGQTDISGIVCLNETTTAGAARAIRGASLTGQVKLVGFDNSEELINYLEEGLLQAVVIQRPFNMGYLAVGRALDVLAGRPVEPFYDTGSLLVTKDIIYQEEIAKLLFPFE